MQNHVHSNTHKSIGQHKIRINRCLFFDPAWFTDQVIRGTWICFTR